MSSLAVYSPLSQTRSYFRTYALEQPMSPGLDHEDFQKYAAKVQFDATEDRVFFPIPFQQTEAIAVLKGIEACWAACIADLRFGQQERDIKVTLERSARYLLGSYLFTIDGLHKLDPGVKAKLKDTDLNQAQSNMYRRYSSNLYASKNPKEYFHLHGSLEASTALRMIGLEPFRPDLTTESECINVIENQVKKFTNTELESLNATNKQAGVTAFKREDFLSTTYGRAIMDQPRWSVSAIESETPPAPFPDTTDNKSILSGVKVIELCRVIAGPSMGRILTEYGADVLKVTSPNLSDVPFFQIEANLGKHTTDLDLRSLDDRKTFEELLQSADIILDGYRTGAIQRLGYGPERLATMAKERGRGFIYVSENCYGYGEHVDRPGWQPVADAASGVSWDQGKFMQLDEPCVPPFPMSDYGTGLMGANAALEAIFRRARYGGSFHAKCALIQYDNFLYQLGQYPDHVQEEMRSTFQGSFFQLRHADSTDAFSGKALSTLKQAVPRLFANEDEWAETWLSSSYGNVLIKVVKPQSNVQGINTYYRRAPRPNGTDEPSWKDWEVEASIS